MEITTKDIKISSLQPNSNQIEGLPRNPRKISKKKLEQLKKSVQDAPEMLRLRELIAVEHDGAFVVICGNQRLEAAKAIGMDTLPVKVLPADTPVEKLREYAIKDNLPFGEDDWEILSSDWNVQELEEWGMEVPQEWTVNPDNFGEDFTLPEGEKGFATMTFTLSNEQQRIIEQTIKDAKQLEEYKYVETFGNTNSNGNALYLIFTQWADARK